MPKTRVTIFLSPQAIGLPPLPIHVHTLLDAAHSVCLVSCYAGMQCIQCVCVLLCRHTSRPILQRGQPRMSTSCASSDLPGLTGSVRCRSMRLCTAPLGALLSHCLPTPDSDRFDIRHLVRAALRCWHEADSVPLAYWCSWSCRIQICTKCLGIKGLGIYAGEDEMKRLKKSEVQFALTVADSPLGRDKLTRALR